MAPPRARRVAANTANRLRIEAAYRAWAESLALSPGNDERAWYGRLRDRGIVVRPGVDGSAPIGVEVEMELAHGEALATLLDEPATALRSIALVPSGLRLRFDALTIPRTVEEIAGHTIDLVAEWTRRGEAPYR